MTRLNHALCLSAATVALASGGALAQTTTSNELNCVGYSEKVNAKNQRWRTTCNDGKAEVQLYSTNWKSTEGDGLLEAAQISLNSTNFTNHEKAFITEFKLKDGTPFTKSLQSVENGEVIKLNMYAPLNRVSTPAPAPAPTQNPIAVVVPGYAVDPKLGLPTPTSAATWVDPAEKAIYSIFSVLPALNLTLTPTVAPTVKPPVPGASPTPTTPPVNDRETKPKPTPTTTTSPVPTTKPHDLPGTTPTTTTAPSPTYPPPPNPTIQPGPGPGPTPTQAQASCPAGSSPASTTVCVCDDGTPKEGYPFLVGTSYNCFAMYSTGGGGTTPTPGTTPGTTPTPAPTQPPTPAPTACPPGTIFLADAGCVPTPTPTPKDDNLNGTMIWTDATARCDYIGEYTLDAPYGWVCSGPEVNSRVITIPDDLVRWIHTKRFTLTYPTESLCSQIQTQAQSFFNAEVSEMRRNSVHGSYFASLDRAVNITIQREPIGADGEPQPTVVTCNVTIDNNPFSY